MRELGFAVSSHESQPSEFELCWLLSRPWKDFHFPLLTRIFAVKHLPRHDFG